MATPVIAEIGAGGRVIGPEAPHAVTHVALLIAIVGRILISIAPRIRVVVVVPISPWLGGDDGTTDDRARSEARPPSPRRASPPPATP